MRAAYRSEVYRDSKCRWRRRFVAPSETIIPDNSEQAPAAIRSARHQGLVGMQAGFVPSCLKQCVDENARHLSGHKAEKSVEI